MSALHYQLITSDLFPFFLALISTPLGSQTINLGDRGAQHKSSTSNYIDLLLSQSSFPYLNPLIIALFDLWQDLQRVRCLYRDVPASNNSSFEQGHPSQKGHGHGGQGHQGQNLANQKEIEVSSTPFISGSC